MCLTKFFKMDLFPLLPLVMLLIHSSVNAAPSQSDIAKLEDIVKIETSDLKVDTPVTLEDATSDKNGAQGQRQKRFYNYGSYGFAPINPVPFPGYPSNDPYQNTFSEDPLQQIYRRLQDIAGVIRTQSKFNQPPPPPPFPILFPVVFVPQVGCGCTPNQGATPKPKPNGTDFDIENRFPDMEDTNQNWGIVVNQNDTEVDDGEDEDFTRPISFQPIRPNRTMTRPPPAVDHGSNQEGRDPMRTTTTMSPAAAAPPAASASAPTRPTVCDAAVLSCCHQAQVTYECFVANGCPDPTAYGNPCEAQTILQVINRFSRFYGQRQG
ncbi:hypothetical protein NE865_16248 [Phthorimaea operculella]|nr:hypothetical protein NE865_16248 [Phthorimaea operculella]